MNNENELIYLASPLTHENKNVMEDRFNQICNIACYLIDDWKLNIFSPIAHSWPIQKYAPLNTSFEYWEQYCYLMVSKCDRVIVAMMDGWKESVGVKAEIDYAKSIGVYVNYFDPLTLEIFQNEPSK